MLFQPSLLKVHRGVMRSELRTSYTDILSHPSLTPYSSPAGAFQAKMLERVVKFDHRVVLPFQVQELVQKLS